VLCHLENANDVNVCVCVFVFFFLFQFCNVAKDVIIHKATTKSNLVFEK
jgi:hypothetical protein